jgi:hypothetical protein
LIDFVAEKSTLVLSFPADACGGGNLTVSDMGLGALNLGLL